MRLSDKKTWDKVIYGLIYPGFLGSMLYELVPNESMQSAFEFYLGSINNFIRYAILIFYFFDYMHLYGDMEETIINPNKKSVWYFLCDILTAFGYLAAFIALKFSYYMIPIIVFGIVPWFFLGYKRKNYEDRKYFFYYGIIVFVIMLYAIFKHSISFLPVFESQVVALVIVSVNVAIYGFYIYRYYEKKSKQVDREFVYKTKLNN